MDFNWKVLNTLLAIATCILFLQYRLNQAEFCRWFIKFTQKPTKTQSFWKRYTQDKSGALDEDDYKSFFYALICIYEKYTHDLSQLLDEKDVEDDLSLFSENLTNFASLEGKDVTLLRYTVMSEIAVHLNQVMFFTYFGEN